MNNFSIAIHGGAGTILKENMSDEMELQYRNALKTAIKVGHEILKSGGTSQLAVEKSINILEDSPLFNSGKGAVLNSYGFAELDASFMNGKSLKAGAVSGARKIKNPISASIKVMENSPHVMLSGNGADQFAEQQGLEIVNSDYFITKRRKRNLEKVKLREVNAKKISNKLNYDEFYKKYFDAMKLGESLYLIEKVYNSNFAFFLDLDNDKIQSIGISFRKVEYIKNVFSFFIENEKEFHHFDEEKMQKELITIKGIGKWTIEMFLMFELGKPDIFSKGDIALINSVKKNYKMNVLKNTELDKLIKSWSPYNSTASLLLWKSIEEKVFFN